MAISDVVESWSHPEKVYIAVGDDLEEGLSTLKWAFKRWCSYPIVILHHSCAPESVNAVNGEKYMALCEKQRKVNAEFQKIERSDQPFQRIILDLIMDLHITKLVMPVSFVRPSPGYSSTSIINLLSAILLLVIPSLYSNFRVSMSASSCLNQNKPEFCHVYILCGGQLVLSREEEIMEGRLNQRDASSSRRSFDFPNSKMQWEIEEYFQKLLDDNNHVAENGSFCNITSTDTDIPDSAKRSEEKVEAVKKQIQEAQRMIQSNRNEVKVQMERQAKARWAIGLCSRRVEDLECRMKEDISSRIEIEKEMEDVREEICDASTDIEESEKRVGSMVEIQSEVSLKLQVLCLAKSGGEIQLEKAASARAKLVTEIEELRRRRSVLQRRVEFCKEKDAISNSMGVGPQPVGVETRESNDTIPDIFLCPILKEVMENPHIAADGHSYELEAIEEWVKAGHDTSPLTNRKLEHKHLIPNHTLRSLIQDYAPPYQIQGHMFYN